MITRPRERCKPCIFYNPTEFYLALPICPFQLQAYPRKLLFYINFFDTFRSSVILNTFETGNLLY